MGSSVHQIRHKTQHFKGITIKKIYLRLRNSDKTYTVKYSDEISQYTRQRELNGNGVKLSTSDTGIMISFF